MRFPRRSGILLHPTSLPGPHGSGDLRQRGACLRRLAGRGRPVALAGAAAGRPRAGQLALHEQLGLRRQRAADRPARAAAARLAHRRGDRAAAGPGRRAHRFRRDGAVPHAAPGARRHAFRAALERGRTRRAGGLRAAACRLAGRLRALHGAGRAPRLARLVRVARRPGRARPAALQRARETHRERIAFWVFCQWCFFRQWAPCSRRAHSRGVQIVGDMPIFVAYQSADVWARPSSSSSMRAAGRPWWPACRPMPSAPPASAGATRCTAGANTRRAATHGGWSACGAASSWSTSCASTTSAASRRIGRFRQRAHRAERRVGEGPARRCSAPLPMRWARCPSSPKTWA